MHKRNQININNDHNKLWVTILLLYLFIFFFFFFRFFFLYSWIFLNIISSLPLIKHIYDGKRNSSQLKRIIVPLRQRRDHIFLFLKPIFASSRSVGDRTHGDIRIIISLVLEILHGVFDREKRICIKLHAVAQTRLHVRIKPPFLVLEKVFDEIPRACHVLFR